MKRWRKLAAIRRARRVHRRKVQALAIDVAYEALVRRGGDRDGALLEIDGDLRLFRRLVEGPLNAMEVLKAAKALLR